MPLNDTLTVRLRYKRPTSDESTRLDVSLVRGLDAGDEVLAVYEAITAEPVPDRPFWDLLAATRCVGIADAWHASWVDFGITDLSLALVEERLAAFVARALSEL